MTYWWESLTDEELLNTRLSDLELSLEESWVAPYLTRLQGEIFAKGLSLIPHFWISDEWFCPDGVTGIALPFFVLHSRLQEIERRMLGECEGDNPRWLMQLLRHEFGHVLDNAYGLRKSARRQLYFGDPESEYPESYEVRPYSKNYVQHLEGHYAQAHPEEDWAETVAVWLTPRSGWRQRYQGWGALKKLELVDKLIEECMEKVPRGKRKTHVDPLHKDKRTLAEYYREKRKRHGLETPAFNRNKLKRIFTAGNGKRAAAQFLKKNRPLIVKEVALVTQQQRYRIKSMINHLEREVAQSEWTLKLSEDKTRLALVDFLSRESPRYFGEGRHHIIM